NLHQKLDFITKGLSFNAKIAYTSGSNYQTNVLRSFGKNFDVISYYRKFDYSNPMEGPDGTTIYPMTQQIRWPDDVTQPGPVSASYDNFSGYGQRLYYEFSTNYSKSIGKHDV